MKHLQSKSNLREVFCTRVVHHSLSKVRAHDISSTDILSTHNWYINKSFSVPKSKTTYKFKLVHKVTLDIMRFDKMPRRQKYKMKNLEHLSVDSQVWQQHEHDTCQF